MITSKKEYRYYLAEDKKALRIKPKTGLQRLKGIFSKNHVWIFQKRLRKAEYYKNVKTSIFGRIYYPMAKYLLRKSSLKLGFTIPENVFGPGLAIVHYGTIIINVNARIGKNCRIHACTNIGASGGKIKAPQIGDNVYIAPGAKIYGDITIANNIAIGANAVVNKSFKEEGIFIAGNPAKKIKEIDITKIIKHL